MTSRVGRPILRVDLRDGDVIEYGGAYYRWDGAQFCTGHGGTGAPLGVITLIADGVAEEAFRVRYWTLENPDTRAEWKEPSR